MNGCLSRRLPERVILSIFLFFAASCRSGPDAPEYSVPSRADSLPVPVSERPEEPVPLEGPLGLEDCIQLALENHESGKISEEDLQIAEALLEKARSAYWPRVTLRGRATRLDEDPFFIQEGSSIQLGETATSFADAAALVGLIDAGIAPQPGNPLFDGAFAAARQQARQQAQGNLVPDIYVKLADRDSVRASLEVSYPLYTGGEISAANAMAEIGVEAARSRRRQTRQEIVFRVISMYRALQLADSLVALGEETLVRFEVLTDLTKRVYESGSGSALRTDYLKIKIFTSAVKGQVSSFEMNRRMAAAALSNAIGLPGGVPLEPKERALQLIPREFDLAALLIEANRDRPELRQLNLGLEAAEHEIERAGSKYLPMVAAFGQVSHHRNAFEKGIVDFERYSWAVGLEVELSLFNGFATRASVSKARAERTRLAHQRELLRKGIDTQIRVEYHAWEGALAGYESAMESLKEAEENRDLNQRAYEADLVDTQDVIEAQLLESITKARHLKALFDLELAAAKLALAVGRDPIADSAAR